MEIDDIFEFGKYKGLTLRQVYQGTPSINKKLIKDFLISKIPTFSKKSGLYFEMAKSISLEITEDCIVLKSDNIDKSPIKRMLEVAFKNGSSYNDIQDGISRLSDYRAKSDDGIKNNLVIGGNPDYVSWCIKKIPSFYIYNDDLSELEGLDIYFFRGIKIIKVEDDSYYYQHKMFVKKMRFRDNFREINESKLNAGVSKRAFEFNDFDDDTYDSFGGNTN